LPVHISHLKSTGAQNWGAGRAVLALIDRENARGARVSFDVYPYLAYSTYSDVLFPSWVLANGQDSVVARIANPVQRARLHNEMKPIYNAQTGGTAASVQFREVKSAPEFAGRTLADYLRARGKSESLDDLVDALIDLQAAGGFTAIVQAMSDRDVDAFLLHRNASISTDGDLVTLGVGFPHPRSYGAFPRVLARYVRERHLLSLESAIAKMTLAPARMLGLTDRGQLRVGAVADIVVFDREHIVDKATFTDPHHYAEGVVHLFVGGTAVLDSLKLTGQRPGIAIRRK
jgi:N-acyl-D-aspartate/D-glutamate deacylase